MLLVLIFLVCEHPDKLIPNTIIPFRNSISSRDKDAFKLCKMENRFYIFMT